MSHTPTPTPTGLLDPARAAFWRQLAPQLTALIERLVAIGQPVAA